MEATLSLTDLGWWQIFIAGISTLAIFSFLYKENPVFRLFEHFYIGIAAGISVIVTIRTFLWTEVLRPMLGLNISPVPDPLYADDYNKMLLLYLLPMGFGLLYYFILSKKHSWIAQLPMGFGFGVSAGMAFEGTLNEMLPQIVDSFRPLLIVDASQALDWAGSLSNMVFIFTLVTAFSYFFFTFKSSEHKVASVSARTGRWMMMGCFGAFFGATIMARMSLLVERLEFLINTWLPQLTLAIGIANAG